MTFGLILVLLPRKLIKSNYGQMGYPLKNRMGTRGMDLWYPFCRTQKPRKSITVMNLRFNSFPIIQPLTVQCQFSSRTAKSPTDGPYRIPGWTDWPDLHLSDGSE